MNNEFDIIEDEPTPYPEKPKRKGKPINWRPIAESALVAMSVVLGIVAGLLVCLFVGGWIGQAATTLTAAMFPDGMPEPPAELYALGGCLGFNIGIGIALGLLKQIVKAVQE
jgi:hypothetical protein